VIDHGDRRRHRSDHWHPRLIAAAAVLVVVLGAVLFVLSRQEPNPRPIATSPGPHSAPMVGAQFHGIWTELSDSDRAKILDALAANGITWVRIDLSWAMLEPRRGEIDEKWAVPLFNKVLGMAHARGLKVLGMFWLTPSWANSGAGRRVLPRDPTDYATALRWAASRWKDQVSAWEVWNEPNSDAFLKPPDPVAYTKLLRTAYPAIKAGDPQAQVVFGGTEYVDTDWITKAYRAGAEGAFDIMSVHPYQAPAAMPPEAPADGSRERITETSELLDIMRRYGDANTPIWYTEFGWSAHENPPNTPPWAKGVSEKVQADYLRRTLALVRTRFPEVTNVFWYTSRDLATGKVHQDHRGLLRRDFTARPVLTTVRCYVRGCQGDGSSR